MSGTASALDEALAALRRRDGARGESAARRALELDPDDPRAHGAMALALLLERRARDAVAPADRAVAGAGGAAWAHLVRSAVLRETGRGRDALAAAEAAARAAPGSARAHVAVALAVIASGGGERAREPLDRARGIAPRDPLVLRLLGELELRRDPARAEELFRASLRADPRSADARGALARALARAGRGDEAESVFETAVAFDPEIGRERESRRRAAIAFFQASLASLFVVLLLMLAPSIVASRWPAARPLATMLGFFAAAAVPIALVAWATLRMRRSREAAPPDPQIQALAEEIAAAGGPVARPDGGA